MNKRRGSAFHDLTTPSGQDIACIMHISTFIVQRGEGGSEIWVADVRDAFIYTTVIPQFHASILYKRIQRFISFTFSIHAI